MTSLICFTGKLHQARHHLKDNFSTVGGSDLSKYPTSVGGSVKNAWLSPPSCHILDSRYMIASDCYKLVSIRDHYCSATPYIRKLLWLCLQKLSPGVTSLGSVPLTTIFTLFQTDSWDELRLTWDWHRSFLAEAHRCA